jgi:hypothetical protein
MCNEFAALPSSSLFPAGIKHGLIEPAPHQRERYELISVTNRVFDLIDQEKDMAVLVTSADGGNDVGLGRLFAFGEDGKSLGAFQRRYSHY